jgi:hypothetical protein
MRSWQVTITGSGFVGATSVTFNGVKASFTVKSGTEITAMVPGGAATGPIRHQNGWRKRQAQDKFHVHVEDEDMRVPW